MMVRVEMIAHTRDALRVLWTSARTCYSAMAPDTLWEQEPTEEDMLRLIRKIMFSQHFSVIEHATATFAVTGVSRSLLAQYSRHRIGVSLSVQSQRYVSEASGKNGGLFDAVMPPRIQENPEARSRFDAYLRDAQAAYDDLLQAGIPKEDARFVLPNAAATNFVTSVNYRSLLDLYRKRVVTPGAQWEIRELVRSMAALLVEREPWMEEFFPAVSAEA